MRKIGVLLLPLCLLLTACGENFEDTVGDLQTLYAGVSIYTAQVQLRIVREEEDIDFTVSCKKEGDTVRVTALSPESVRGISAVIEGEALALEYGGTILDAGVLSGGFSAVSCVPMLLDALPESYVSSWAETQLDGAEVLRVCFDAAWGGETVTCTAYFDRESRPVYAEFSQNGKIFAAAGFTDFTFDDILSPDGQE